MYVIKSVLKLQLCLKTAKQASVDFGGGDVEDGFVNSEVSILSEFPCPCNVCDAVNNTASLELF